MQSLCTLGPEVGKLTIQVVSGDYVTTMTEGKQILGSTETMQLHHISDTCSAILSRTIDMPVERRAMHTPC